MNLDLLRRNDAKLGIAGLVGGSIGGCPSGTGSRSNPIEDENDRTGTDDWLATGPSDDPLPGAYSTELSVDPGGSVDFHVSTPGGAPYRIDVYRLGWYDGDGARKVTTLPETGGGSPGREQPVPAPDPETGLVECDWDVTDTLEVPAEWTTGLYEAKVVLASGDREGESTAHPFVVRESPDRDSPSSIVVQLPFSTSWAYNGWGGKSLYDHTSDGEPADVVSYHRPHSEWPINHTMYAIHLIRFLEAEGYDVSYVTNVDTHRDPDHLQEHDLAISAGHDEYWSAEEYNAFEDARDGGTNLAFVGANIAYWQVRYEDDEATMICYKETVEEDPLYGTGDETDRFRNVGRPECELLGVMSVGAGLYNFPDYTVEEGAVDHPWMDDTGFEAGDEIVGVVGHEWDWIRDDCDVPGEVTTFFHYERGTSDLEITIDRDADAVTYEAPSGARVFSAGTLGFPYRLDPDPSWNDKWPYARVQAYKPEVLEPDPRLQQFSRNVLDDMV